ncbi:MAG: sulfatase-like hydrolase/transferase [Candidatus Hodarchaeota archaeon]
MNQRPNIIYILNDHQAFYGHGKMVGGPKIHRPNFEKLANEGIEFTQAYTACPLCGPARRTMLTGLFPHNHGEIHNETNHKYDKEVYLNILAKAGYKNYYYGKWHAGRGSALNFKCKGFSSGSRYGNPYISHEYKEYLKRHKLPFIQAKIQKNFLGPEHPYTKALGIQEGKLHNPKFPILSQETTGIMTTPKETHEAFFLASLACEQLQEIAKSSQSTPFHLRLDFWGPHFPYFATQEYLNLYNPKDINELPSFRDDLQDKPSIYKLSHHYPISENGQLLYPNPLPWTDWQKVLALNYAQQTLIDEAGGMILDTLEELGLIDNTIIIWASDHGDAVGCHGGHFDKDSFMPQEMIRIAMVISYPDHFPKGEKCDKLVSNLDLAPTFLDAAGTNFAESPDGESLMPLCTNKDALWRNDLLCETYGHWTNHIGRVVVSDRYKYVYNDGDMDEFYDLRKDPFELNNLINIEEYNDVCYDMKLRLKNWRQKSGDNIRKNMIKGKKLIK